MSGGIPGAGPRGVRLTRRTLVAGLALLGSGVGASGARAQASEAAPADTPAKGETPPAPIRIGLAHPVAGRFGALGGRCRLGAYRAIATVNAAGGIASLGGARLEPFEGNIGPASGAAAEVVQAMNGAAVAAIVGAATTPLSRQVAEAAARVSLPHLVDGAIGSAATNPETGRSLRIGPDYDQFIDGLVALLDGMVANEHIRARVTEATEDAAAARDDRPAPDATIALLRDPHAYGERVEEDIRARLSGTTGTAPTRSFAIERVLDFPPQPSESAGLLGFLQEPEADVVVMVGYGEAQAALFAAAAERALVPRAPVIGFLGGISTSDRFGPAALRGAEGVVELTVAPDPAKEGTAALRESFALWNIPLSLDAYLAHESVMLLADALERAATTDRSAVLEALAAGAWDSASLPFGPTAFAAGRNDSAVPQGFQLRKGVLVPIGTDGAGFAGVSQRGG